MVRIENLKKYFHIKGLKDPIKAVDGVSLEIRKGQVMGLVGESGCGKSTLARLVLLLLEPDSGKIIVDDIDTSALNTYRLKRFRKKCQMVFQDPYDSLNPKQRAGAAILEAPVIHRRVNSRGEAKKLLSSLLDMVGLPLGAAGKFPHQFSGGERQRVCIARALSLKPEILVLDEPVSNLDVSIQAQILNLLLQLKKELGLTYLFISHDLSVVKFLSDEVCVMRGGKIVEHGVTSDVYKSPGEPYTRLLLESIPRIR
ncbi:MAG: ATP-binding cassette domain-containing protein [Candidatus Omnitrophota bacterium]